MIFVPLPEPYVCGKMDGELCMHEGEASLSSTARPVFGLLIIKLIVPFLLSKDLTDPLLLLLMLRL